MGRGSKREAREKPWEGNPHRYVRLTHEMYQSAAWKSLSLQQRGLYGEFRKKYTENTRMGTDNHNNIEMTVAEWRLYYGNNYRAWKADRNALIEHGFIKVVDDWGHVRKPIIYGFDDKWKTWHAHPEEK